MVQVNWIRGNTVRYEKFRTNRAAKKAIKKTESEYELSEAKYFPSGDKIYFVWLEDESVG